MLCYTMNKCIESFRTPSQQYPKIMYKGKTRAQHRVLYESYHGTIPKHMVIRHLCHNPRCINIKHLAIGTQYDNMQDSVQDNRTLKGTKNHQNKLTKKQAYTIKYGNENRTKLAKKFKVSVYAIDRIRKGVNWKWL